MKKLRTVWFYDEVYRTNYMFLVGDCNQAVKYVKKNHKTTLAIGDQAEGKIWDCPGYGYYIWMRIFNYNPRYLGTLMHEITHAVLWELERAGIKPHAENEPFTYYAEFIMRKFLELWNKKY